MPLIKQAWEKYRNDDGVEFVLVSLDDDPERLGRFLEQLQPPFPVARASYELADEHFQVDNVPATFYIDRAGIVRYDARGVETHGDSVERVIWYIDELKRD